MVQSNVRDRRPRPMQHNGGLEDFISKPQRPLAHLTVRAIVRSIVLATIPAAANLYSAPVGATIASAHSIRSRFPWRCPAPGR
jgi:hypothetical protein